MNTGHDVRLILDDLGPGNVNITGGPLSYMYRAVEVLFHFGSSEHQGSEHAIMTFAAEVGRMYTNPLINVYYIYNSFERLIFLSR